MNQINVAIIGCGSIFPVHAEAIMKNPLLKLCEVVDIDETKAKNAAQSYNCNYSSDYHETLRKNQIDVVHICTPHYLHAEMAIEAMRSGKHVLCEKPMAITLEDAKKMINVSKETGKKLGICFQNRYNETSKKIKEYISSEKMGKILGAKAILTWCRDKDYYNSAGWRGTWEKEGGGLLINQAIHTLDLMRWFLGEISMIKASVDTRLLSETIEVEDTAEATIVFKNGVNAHFYATNCYSTNSPVELELHFENGLITLKEDVIIQYADGHKEFIANPRVASGDKAYWGLSHEMLIEDFCHAIMNGNEFAVNGSKGIDALKIVKAIYKSNETHKYVEID